MKAVGALLLLLITMASVMATPAPATAAELVMFDDPACVYCRRWLAEVGPGYPHTDEGKMAPLRRIPVQEQRGAGLALKSPVNATPTFVLADDAGREVGRITGYPGAEHFYPMLNELLRKLPQVPAPKPPLRETRLH